MVRVGGTARWVAVLCAHGRRSAAAGGLGVEMAQQIDLSGDGGVLKQIVAEGAGAQVRAMRLVLMSGMRVVRNREMRALRCVVAATQVEPGQTVFAHYTGKLQSGEIFDSTTGKPHRQKHGFYFTPGAGEVIQGWDVVSLPNPPSPCASSVQLKSPLLLLCARGSPR